MIDILLFCFAWPIVGFITYLFVYTINLDPDKGTVEHLEFSGPDCIFFITFGPIVTFAVVIVLIKLFWKKITEQS